jgi:dihydrofolate synthase/folylpolyglutamate synthase
VPFERYHEAVDYLQRRLWHDLPIVPIERALQARVREVLAHLDNPHERFPVVHVGGSAGKGSTATIAASILRAAGLRTGLYTSPHLQTFIERIDVDRTLIAPDRFADIVLALEPLVRRMHLDVIDGKGYGRPALVEVAFATGMKHFADERCDAATVEVGLGGRTDCTNVFEAPHVSVLTNVDFEHRERLGWTIESIATEKAAIINGGTVVTGAARAEALGVIERRCADTGARLLRLRREIALHVTAADAGGTTFDLRTPHARMTALRLQIAGSHQATNAALAVAAAQAFAELHGVEIGEDAVRTGLGQARINGRLEAVQRRPLVLLDSAHNPAEARALASALAAHYVHARRKLHLVCGILGDKDQASMVRALAPIAARVVVTRSPLEERAGDPQRTVGLFARALGGRRVTFEPSPERALDLALDAARADDFVCVTGSMYLVGRLRGRWLPERRILERRSAALPDESTSANRA